MKLLTHCVDYDDVREAKKGNKMLKSLNKGPLMRKDVKAASENLQITTIFSLSLLLRNISDLCY